MIDEFFLFARWFAVVAISESDPKLIVGPPHHIAGTSVAKGSP
jgi:hypothetical protein